MKHSQTTVRAIIITPSTLVRHFTFSQIRSCELVVFGCCLFVGVGCLLVRLYAFDFHTLENNINTSSSTLVVSHDLLRSITSSRNRHPQSCLSNLLNVTTFGLVMTSITSEQSTVRRSSRDNQIDGRASRSRQNSIEQDEQKIAHVGNNENKFSLKHESEQEQKQSTDNSTDQPSSTFRSNHDLLKHDDNYSDEDEELSTESPTNTSNKRSVSASSKRDGAGSSCHQCKSAKDPSMLLFCSSPAEKGHRKRKCRKKYCESCLKRSYPAGIGEPKQSNSCVLKSDSDPTAWTCPSCLGICVCAACCRLSTGAGRESVMDGINALHGLPAPVLSFLGIRSEKLAEIQMLLSNQPGTPAHPLGPLEDSNQTKLTQIINSVHAHDQALAQSVNQTLPPQLMMSNQYEPNMSYQQAELARDMIAEQVQTHLLHQAVHSSMLAESLHQSLAHQSACQSNTRMSVGPNTPASRVVAEIDLTDTPLQQSMPQPVSISPLQSSNHHALHISPLQHVRNQSYHSTSGSANGSPSSIATTNSMHSQPISPASLSQTLHESSNQNYALISSNPTSENYGLRRHGHSNHSVMNQPQSQYSQQAVFNDHQQWSANDIENESRRLAAQSINHPSNQSMNDTIMNMMAVRSLNEFDQSCNPLMSQSTYQVETRKRAHSACMSDVTDDQLTNQPVSARQRVSPPGLPRSINSSSGQPRKRSADQHTYHHSTPGHSRHLSQEQLEWEMTRQMQEHSLNQSVNPTNYNFSPSMNPSSNHSIAQSVAPYDINYSETRRRYSRVQPFDLEQQLVNQSMYMMDQQSAIQSLSVMDQAAIEQNMSNQSINHAYTQSPYNQAVSHYDAPANHQADVMRPVMEAETMILQCRQIQHYQQQVLNQAQSAPQTFNQF